MNNSAADPEEVARFQKAFRHCRTCDHIQIAHAAKAKGREGRCLDSKLTNKEVHESCTCTQFIPKDNLEYLEWVAANKEKKA